jgi:uncharacterized protein (UPF0128 family)
MKAIERAKSHFKRLVDEPKTISVPEWAEEGEEFIIYSTPLTLNERVKLNRHANNTIEMGVEMLIMKAKDKDGNLLFSKEDKPEMMRAVDATVVARIAQHIAGVSDDELVEEAEKN